MDADVESCLSRVCICSMVIVSFKLVMTSQPLDRRLRGCCCTLDGIVLVTRNHVQATGVRERVRRRYGFGARSRGVSRNMCVQMEFDNTEVSALAWDRVQRRIHTHPWCDPQPASSLGAKYVLLHS